MGARLLRAWMLRPEISSAEIEAAARCRGGIEIADRSRERKFAQNSEAILDLERLTSRMTLGVATPRDLLALRGSLEKIPRLRQLMHMGAETGRAKPAQPEKQRISRPASDSNRTARRRSIGTAARTDGRVADVRDLIARGIADDPPALANEAGVIRRGFHAELDELRDITKQGRQIIAAMEERERKRTGIASLKIRYNQVFGYYIEISKANLHLAPADYERKQTLVNAERFTSGELKEYERKVLSAEERVLEIERRLYGEIREAIAREAARLRRTAAAIAQLDVLVNFARIAASRNYTRPEFTRRQISQGRPARGTTERRGDADDRGRPPSRDRKTARRARRTIRAERSVSRRRIAIPADHHRAEHGRQVDVPAPGGADLDSRADGIVRSGGAGEIAAAGPDFHAHRRVGQSGARAVDVSGGDERGGGDSEHGDVRKPRAARRSGARNGDVRRAVDRLGGGGSAARAARGRGRFSPRTITS